MEELIERIRDGLSRGIYANERAVSTSIVVPVLRALGWDDSDPEAVMPEYTTGRGRVDYALRCAPHPVAAFIEVKHVGRSGDADRQLFEYAFHEGVPLAVLTDGREWNFYLPAQQGSYADRRAYQLVLDERDVGESVVRLRRYLERARLASGTAIEDAVSDYRDARSRRHAADTMPAAWAMLLAEPDPLLVARLLEQTEALCGFQPADEQAIAFLRGASGPSPAPPRPVRPSTPSSPPAAATVRIPVDADGEERGGCRWRVGDRSGIERNAVTAFVAYLDAVFAAAPDRRQHIAAAARTRSRNNIAADLADVYPRHPEIAAKSHRRLANGLIVGTNLSNAEKQKLARQTAAAAGLTYGIDAALDL